MRTIYSRDDVLPLPTQIGAAERSLEEAFQDIVARQERPDTAPNVGNTVIRAVETAQQLETVRPAIGQLAVIRVNRDRPADYGGFWGSATYF
jgi:hypothetical protein